jgi:hypothetical protein
VNPKVVIESYVVDVMRRVPARDRNEVGLELRGLLTEMLDDRAQDAGHAADDALVLAMLREFGTPAEIAARYRPPDAAGAVIIPANGTRSFALTALAGLGLQWALTLPHVFDGSLRLVSWWFSWGLGAFWWPGFMVVMSIIGMWLKSMGLFKPRWKPRIADPDRIDRAGMTASLVGIVIATGFWIAFPWLVDLMPVPLSRVLAFDSDFLRARAWPALVLWLGSFATLVAVRRNGRHTSLTRRLEFGTSLGFVALLAWWMSAGNIFIEKATDDGARGALALVIVIICIDLAVKLYRGRPRIEAPRVMR